MKPEFKTQQSKKISSLIITGDLVVQYSEQLKDHLQLLLASGDELELSLAGVNAMDVSAVQLIYAFKAIGKAGKKKLFILLSENKGVVELLGKTGLIGLISNESAEKK